MYHKFLLEAIAENDKQYLIEKLNNENINQEYIFEDYKLCVSLKLHDFADILIQSGKYNLNILKKKSMKDTSFRDKESGDKHLQLFYNKSLLKILVKENKSTYEDYFTEKTFNNLDTKPEKIFIHLINNDLENFVKELKKLNSIKKQENLLLYLLIIKKDKTYLKKFFENTLLYRDKYKFYEICLFYNEPISFDLVFYYKNLDFYSVLSNPISNAKFNSKLKKALELKNFDVLNKIINIKEVKSFMKDNYSTLFNNIEREISIYKTKNNLKNF